MSLLIRCEMIVRHEWSSRVDFVTNYLREHQAMGVYLYGEMVAARSAKFASAASTVFAELESEMDPQLAVTVRDLLGT